MPLPILPLLLLTFLALASPLAAEPPSLVDRLMSLLKKDAPPSVEAPAKESATDPETTAPAAARKDGPEIAKNFLPVYDLARGRGEEEVKPRVLPFFSSSALQDLPGGILSIVILIPDSDRDAARAFAYARKAQDAASAQHPEWLAKDAFLFVPQFLNPEDIPGKNEALLRWAGGSWIYGGDTAMETLPGALNAQNMSSYAVLDFVLLALARHDLFPELERVVIAGSGAGGDFVQRYAALGKAADVLVNDDIAVRYVAANSWSYLYFDKQRQAPVKDDPLMRGAQEAVFAEPRKEDCAPANAYPYGFESLPDYGKKQGESEIRMRYDRRHVIYLVGKDAVKEAKDSSPQACAAGLQGKNISQRAQIYFSHLKKLYGEEAITRGQRLYLAPKVNEAPEGLWQSPCGLSSLFGDGSCAPGEGKNLKILD